MILYFADRQMNIIGQASTSLPKGLTVVSDKKTEDIDVGVAIFECYIPFDSETRAKVAACTEVGNYILRSHNNENEFYTIIESETDTKKQEVYIYAEDAGMDLLNEVVGAYEADKAYPISHYVNKYASNSGFQIGTNEAAGLTRKLSWDGDSTATERILSVATQFDNCEVSFSFVVDGLYVTKKLINIHKKRGTDSNVQLRLNKEIDSIITTKSIANLATALQCVGGTPDPVENEETGESEEQPPITLSGYSYDDGDFYIDGVVLKSREALKQWARLLWKTDGTQQAGGHITKQFSYNTLSQKELCNRAIAELKKIRDAEVNYEADIKTLPVNVGVGDRVNIIDEAGKLYLSTRLLTIETSIANNERRAVLGEYLIKSSGISQKIENLANQFSVSAAETARAIAVASNAAQQAIKETSDNIRGTIDEQTANTVQTCETMLAAALEEYTPTGDFEAYKEATDTQVKLLVDQTTKQLLETNSQLEAINRSLQEQINTITKYLTFDVNGLTIGQLDNPYKVVIDNDEILILVNGNAVQRFDASGNALMPKAKVTENFDLLGFLFAKDSAGNVNCEYVGGES